MFQTDELVKIINQLQHAAGMGYFETLGLILKLLGLCVGPVMIIVAAIAIEYFLPKLVAKRFVSVPNDYKQYNIFIYCDQDKNRFEHCCTRMTEDLLQYLNKQEKFRIITSWILIPIITLFLSPILFININVTIILVFVFCVALLIKGYNTWTVFDSNSIDIAPDYKRYKEKGYKLGQKAEYVCRELNKEYPDPTKISDTDKEECAKRIKEKLEDSICDVSVRLGRF